MEVLEARIMIVEALLRLILARFDLMELKGDAKMSELDDKLNELNTKLDQANTVLGEVSIHVPKIAQETDNILASLQILVDNPPSGITAEQQNLLNSALEKASAISTSADALKTSIAAIDDKVPDNPPSA